MSIIPTGPKDVRDAAWLAEQVADLGRGIEAARLIWSNWFDGRQVGRLHPGQTPGDYIASLGLRLTLPEALAAMPEASPAQVAAVSGVHRTTVVRERDRQGVQLHTVTGADGKSYPRVVREVKAEVIETSSAEPFTTVGAIQRTLPKAWAGWREHWDAQVTDDPAFDARLVQTLDKMEVLLKKLL